MNTEYGDGDAIRQIKEAVDAGKEVRDLEDGSHFKLVKGEYVIERENGTIEPMVFKAGEGYRDVLLWFPTRVRIDDEKLKGY